jgi:hypothetical protein
VVGISRVFVVRHLPARLNAFFPPRATTGLIAAFCRSTARRLRPRLFSQPTVPRFAACRSRQECHVDLAVYDGRRGCLMKLNGGNAVAHLEGEPCIHIERHVLGHLADDRHKLSGRHVGPFALFDVPQLNEDFRPGLRVCSAVKGRKRSSLDLGDVIAGLHRPSVIAEHQRLVLVIRQKAKEVSDGDVVGHEIQRLFKFAVVRSEHLRYPLF